MLTSKDVKKGDFFTLSQKKGYNEFYRDIAMQVVECRDRNMTVKSLTGCLTKNYDHFEKVEDVTKCDTVCYSKSFNDYRTKANNSIKKITIVVTEEEGSQDVEVDIRGFSREDTLKVLHLVLSSIQRESFTVDYASEAARKSWRL